MFLIIIVRMCVVVCVQVRLTMYRKRKAYLEGMMAAESAKLDSQARFIMEIIEKKLVISNKKKALVVKLLQSSGYPSDPVKKWKNSVSDDVEEEEGEEGEGEREGGGSMEDGADYNYLLSMSLWSLTLEKKEEIMKKRDEKAQELKVLQGKTPKDLWSEDIDMFMQELDRVEEEERADEAAGARITKKKKTKGKQGGRQAKLATDSGNSFKETRPSPFAELVAPVIPEFSTERKTAGKGRGRVKSEPKTSTGEVSGGNEKEDPKQKKLKFESSDKTKEEGEGGGKAKKAPTEKPSQAKKRKVKEMVDSFVISSDSEEEVEEREMEKKSLHERIELRKTKVAEYKDILSGEESVESEASWKSESDDGGAPPIKKAKLAAGGSKTAVPTGESVEIDEVSSETTEAAEGAKSKKTAPKPDRGAGVKGKGKKESAASKSTAAKLTAKPAAKPSKAGARKATSSSSGSGSGEKKKQGKVTLAKKRVVSHDFVSDEESDYSIESGSGSDSLALPSKKAATEAAKCRPRRGQRVKYNVISDSDDSDFMA
ncbi:DNA topoisomerase 2-beta [Geodia barretti]|uniref:DNA topoisomerase (ATP-hydrolyzing) n=1 Tax=Geodia barretti TaxID=519541 RepID=A0AA35S4Z3_GEOBA|nr:DNA topoisomerase 2-beta [Geodia barretti]